MPAKKRQPTKKSKSASTRKASTIAASNNYDKPKNLVIAGVIGVVLSYILLSRALNTGSYWEYFFGLAVIFIAIRLFIRSIRLK